ncbi:MAG: hypothetical protein ACLFQZ_07960 [Spirochaetaceae bacterium]
MRIRTTITSLALLFLAIGILGAQEQQQEEEQQEQQAEEEEENQLRNQEVQLPSGADGAVKLLNVENFEWRAVDVAGEGVFSALGGSLIRLRIGGRYHIDLRGVDSDALPLDVRSVRGSVLFSQREDAESMEMEGVDPEVSSDGITFTLTEELAPRIASYRASAYPGMVGFVSAVPQESGEGDGGDQEEEGEAEQTD